MVDILEHHIHKAFLEFRTEIEKLPASEQQTKVSLMAGTVWESTNKLVKTLQEIKSIVLNMTPETQKGDLPHVVRLCIDAGIFQDIDQLEEMLKAKVADG